MLLIPVAERLTAVLVVRTGYENDSLLLGDYCASPLGVGFRETREVSIQSFPKWLKS